MTPTPITQRLADALRELNDAAGKYNNVKSSPHPLEEARRNAKNVLLAYTALAHSGGEGELVGDDELRRLWKRAGGEFYGPKIEHGTMAESKLLPFLRELIAMQPPAQPLRAPDTAPKGDAEWLRRKLEKNDDTNCAAGGGNALTNSCLCCGHVGERKAWSMKHPDIYVCDACWKAAHERDTLLAENARNAKDAERYRWLRAGDGRPSYLPHIMQAPYVFKTGDTSTPQIHDANGMNPEMLDSAIDAAIDAAKRGGA